MPRQILYKSRWIGLVNIVHSWLSAYTLFPLVLLQLQNIHPCWDIVQYSWVRRAAAITRGIWQLWWSGDGSLFTPLSIMTPRQPHGGGGGCYTVFEPKMCWKIIWPLYGSSYLISPKNTEEGLEVYCQVTMRWLMQCSQTPAPPNQFETVNVSSGSRNLSRMGDNDKILLSPAPARVTLLKLMSLHFMSNWLTASLSVARDGTWRVTELWCDMWYRGCRSITRTHS